MSISHKREIVIKSGRNRKKRPKTFKSEEAAKRYAEANKIKTYSLKNLKSDASAKKKIMIVAS